MGCRIFIDQEHAPGSAMREFQEWVESGAEIISVSMYGNGGATPSSIVVQFLDSPELIAQRDYAAAPDEFNAVRVPEKNILAGVKLNEETGELEFIEARLADAVMSRIRVESPASIERTVREALARAGR